MIYCGKIVGTPVPWILWTILYVWPEVILTSHKKSVKRVCYKPAHHKPTVQQLATKKSTTSYLRWHLTWSSLFSMWYLNLDVFHLQYKYIWAYENMIQKKHMFHDDRPISHHHLLIRATFPKTTTHRRKIQSSSVSPPSSASVSVMEFLHLWWENLHLRKVRYILYTSTHVVHSMCVL